MYLFNRKKILANSLPNNKQKSFSFINFTRNLVLLMFIVGIIMFFADIYSKEVQKIQQRMLPSLYNTPSLVMEGGDPYIRALMRTISASESNYKHPYNVIYTGKYVEDLSRHPNICITIVMGPNKGNCTTAAGRYQFLNNTWDEKATQYHPKPYGILKWKTYSFQPEYQDVVVYNWLNDSQAWGYDISKLLQQEKIEEVLRLLSPTWTSLGYGIENNSMSQYLPKIYKKTLNEELEIKNQNKNPNS